MSRVVIRKQTTGDPDKVTGVRVKIQWGVMPGCVDAESWVVYGDGSKTNLLCCVVDRPEHALQGTFAIYRAARNLARDVFGMPLGLQIGGGEMLQVDTGVESVMPEWQALLDKLHAVKSPINNHQSKIS